MVTQFRCLALSVFYFTVHVLSSHNVLCTVAVSPEFRALWIATASNIDWPEEGVFDTVAQQDDLIEYLDMMQATNFNALFFHVRPKGDAFYNSTIEPWSKYLKGTQGLAPDPYYDPLQFVLEEASRRNIEVHAWLNPYLANSPGTWEGLTEEHVAVRYPQYAYPHESYLWMDPGAKPVQDNLRDVIMDVITRYDVAGIHFDDFFYPYPEEGLEFPDNATYTEYVEDGGSLSLDDWRRENINSLIRTTYYDIKAYNSYLQFSVSPFGLYRPGEPEGMPEPIQGLDPYSELYADSKLWLQSGWLDALIPQLYWEIDPPEQSYPVCLDWWLGVNNASCLIYAGNAAYKLSPEEGNYTVGELVRQAEISRLPDNRARQSLGNVWFSARYFKANYRNVTTAFSQILYKEPATLPSLRWVCHK